MTELQAPGIAIRRARRSDLPGLVDWNLRLARESEGLELDPSTVTAGVKAVLADSGKGAYFLAQVAGRAVGQLMVTVEWSDWRNGPIWWLQSVYVEPAHRGSGVFRALFEEVQSLASGSGVRLLRLYVEEGNRAALEVYRRLGMHPTGYRVWELSLPGSGARVDGEASAR